MSEDIQAREEDIPEVETPEVQTPETVVETPVVETTPVATPAAEKPAEATPAATEKPVEKPAEPAVDPKIAEAAAAEQRELQSLVGEYQDLLAKMDKPEGEEGAFDIMEDGPKAVKNSMKLVGVLAKRVATLEGDLAARTQKSAAERFWSEDYAQNEVYSKVPVEDGKTLWNQSVEWAKKNNRNPEAAQARWETLMEAKAAAPKPALPAPKPTAPQTRPTGKPTPQAAEKVEEDEGLMTKVSRSALERLGW